MNIIKKDIESNYFFFRDLLLRMLIYNLVLYKLQNYQVVAYFEQPELNSLYYESVNRINLNLDPKDLAIYLKIDNYMALYLDVSIYLDEFIQKKHICHDRIQNVYSLFIQENGKLDFILRQLPVFA